MKKRILTLLSLLLIAGLLIKNNGFGLFDKKIVYAVGDLTVAWATDPLFNETNIAPGFTTTKTVTVSNGATSFRPVGVRGILTSDAGNMSSVMDIEIKEGTTILYSNTLAQFFTDSSGPNGILLSNLSSGSNTQYNFIVTFNTAAGNDYQNKTILFDLQIGISIDLPTACEQINLLPTPIIGTSKAETLTGTPSNDLIMGLEGADKINGNGGNDCILGGTGADSINGNNGDDVIFGEDGADSIRSNHGDDSLFGGNGADSLDGENGNDYIEGGDSADSMRGGNGNDTLIGGTGNDTANGGANTDNCLAEAKTQCEL